MAYLALLLASSVAAGLAGGVAVATLSALTLALLLSAAWAVALLAYRRAHPASLLAALTLVVVGAGWMLGQHAIDRAIRSPLRQLLEARLGPSVLAESGVRDPVVIEGRLRDDAIPTEAGVVLRIDVARVWLAGVAEPTAGGVSVGVSGSLVDEGVAAWRAGAIVRAPALLRRPARYLNHGVPDQERAIARRGVSLVGTIKSAALIEVVDAGRWWDRLAGRVRARTRSALARHVRPFGDQSAALATAILIGDRALLDADVERRLQEAGTYHVIAISGGNIAILAAVLLAALALIGVRGRLAAVIVIGALCAYASIAAGGPSVARATLMAIVYLALRLIDQRTASTNAVAVAGTLVLLSSPLSIVDVGFWLTFGATAALIVVAAAAPPEWTRRDLSAEGVRARWMVVAKRVITLAAAVVAATLAVEIVLIPIGAATFQRITVAGVLLNGVALPAMTLLQIAAMALVACDALGGVTLAMWLGWAVHAASAALVESTQLLDYAPWLTWRVTSPSWPLLAVYYLVLTVTVISAFMGWRGSPTRVARFAAISLLLWIAVAPGARVRAHGDGALHLSMIDVGQGDAALVTLPNGRTLLVDSGGLASGGDFDIGERVIAPALRARGLLSLDYLAVTHSDADHVGGARTLIRDFDPREVWWGVPVANHQPTALVRAEADKRRAGWRTLQRGDRIEIGDAVIHVHHPPRPDWERQKVRNNDSLVIEIRFREVSFLLTGDIGREIEAEVLPGLDLPPTVILKVAHHGSATSSSRPFVDGVRPAVAVIGVGRGNIYGHPTAAVLTRLAEAESEVFRTDRDGQVDIVSDGQAVAVTTWTGRRASARARARPSPAPSGS